MSELGDSRAINRLTMTAVRVYAILDNFGNGSTDVIDRLIPFLEPILAARAGQQLNTADLAADVRAAYKWNFNEDIVEVFVPRLEHNGWLVARDAAKTSYFVAQKSDIISADSVSSNEGVMKSFYEIAIDFKKFSEALSPLTALPRSVEEFQDILIEWLIYVEAFSEHNLNFKPGVQKDSTGILRQVVGVPDTTTHPR